WVTASSVPRGRHDGPSWWDARSRHRSLPRGNSPLIFA
ncbi:MAG: hypothetical protein AVDCRST_MAG33-1108, partial [uncultured Thermomicrobiales bacterium]